MAEINKQLKDDIRALDDYLKHTKLAGYMFIVTNETGKDYYVAYNHDGNPLSLLQRVDLFLLETKMFITLKNMKEEQELEVQSFDKVKKTAKDILQ